ncbi:MAG: family 10 glycosylhydrolase, partial [Clostridia bacterium]|nr:family 10 glycosylhydrolase [Clostridia bacterium]
TSQMSGDPDHVGHHNEDWILLDKDGKGYYISPEYGNFVFLNPQNRECRDLVLEVYRELLENYDIDGIHLDYIRYPEHNGSADFGYNEDTIKAFQKEYGYTTDPHNYKAGSKEYRDWIAFRQDVITTFVKEVNDLVKEVRPEVWITAACYPSLTDAPNQIYQYTSEWVKLGYIDQVFSMTYSNGTEYVKSNAESFIKACKDKALYSTGLTLFSGNSGEELLSQIKGVREVGATGQAFFSLSSLLGFEEYENIIINHAYRNKAVSLFDVDGAVLAYANDLLEKCDGVYSQRTEGQEEVIAKVKKLLTEIKTEAEKQEYNTVEEQKALLAYVTERTEAILAEAKNADSNLKNALNREAGEMHYNLSVLYTRMEAKTAQ